MDKRYTTGSCALVCNALVICHALGGTANFQDTMWPLGPLSLSQDLCRPAWKKAGHLDQVGHHSVALSQAHLLLWLLVAGLALVLAGPSRALSDCPADLAELLPVGGSSTPAAAGPEMMPGADLWLVVAEAQLATVASLLLSAPEPENQPAASAIMMPASAPRAAPAVACFEAKQHPRDGAA